MDAAVREDGAGCEKVDWLNIERSVKQFPAVKPKSKDLGDFLPQARQRMALTATLATHASTTTGLSMACTAPKEALNTHRYGFG